MILGTLTEIIQGPEGGLRAVEIAGRGVAAEVRCTLAVLADKGIVSPDPGPVVVDRSLAFADRLVALGEIGDSLAELWRLRRAKEIADAPFEVALGRLVRRLEEWPRGLGSGNATAPTT